MRLIDADALLEEMVGITDGWLKPPKGWKWYEDSVRNAPTVGGWISIKDDMPELEGDYWVTDGYHVPWKCRLLKLGDVKGWVNGASNPVINYWMPMPELPKEGEVE